MSTMGKFSRTDSLLFKDKNFLYPRPNGSRDTNPTVLKGMNTEAWRFRLTEYDVSISDAQTHY